MFEMTDLYMYISNEHIIKISVGRFRHSADYKSDDQHALKTRTREQLNFNVPYLFHPELILGFLF